MSRYTDRPVEVGAEADTAHVEDDERQLLGGQRLPVTPRLAPHLRPPRRRRPVGAPRRVPRVVPRRAAPPRPCVVRQQPRRVETSEERQVKRAQQQPIGEAEAVPVPAEPVAEAAVPGVDDCDGGVVLLVLHRVSWLALAAPQLIVRPMYVMTAMVVVVAVVAVVAVMAAVAVR